MARIILFFVLLSTIQSFTDGETFPNQRNEDMSNGIGLKLKAQVQTTAELGTAIHKKGRNTRIKAVISPDKASLRRKSIEPDTEQDTKGNPNQGLGYLVSTEENTMETRADAGNTVLLEDSQKNIKLSMPRNNLLVNNAERKRVHGNKRNVPAHKIRHWSSRGHAVFDSLVRRIQRI